MIKSFEATLTVEQVRSLDFLLLVGRLYYDEVTRRTRVGNTMVHMSRTVVAKTRFGEMECKLVEWSSPAQKCNILVTFTGKPTRLYKEALHAFSIAGIRAVTIVTDNTTHREVLICHAFDTLETIY